MTKKLKLTKGFTALVDDEDFDYLSQWKWSYDTGYAVRHHTISRVSYKIRLHREVMKDPYCSSSLEIDHVNSNTLDNRKENLRWATRSQNVRNSSLRSDNKCGYIGVSSHAETRRWRARIIVDGKEIRLGWYDKPVDAAKAYNDAAIRYFGKFAKLNEIKE